MAKNRAPIAAVAAAMLGAPLVIGMGISPTSGSLAEAAVAGTAVIEQDDAKRTTQGQSPSRHADLASVSVLSTGTGVDTSATATTDDTGSDDAATVTTGDAGSSGAASGTDAGTATPDVDTETDADSTAPEVDPTVPEVDPTVPDVDTNLPVVDSTAPVINGSAFGPVKGQQTFTLSQVEENPQKAYVEIQQMVNGKWVKSSGEWFFGTNTFAFNVNTDALADGPATQLKVSSWDDAGNQASKTFPVTIDRVKPTVTLVTPTSSDPQASSSVTIEVDAADDHGLNRMTANIYQGKTLVKSTSSSAAGLQQAVHQATATLPDGEYTIRYNASDLAGNLSTTHTQAVELDTAAPVITVKDGASVVNGIHNKVPSFKLMDQGVGEVDYVIANGVTLDRTNNKWSDLNAGNYTAVQGENVITLVDTAGNKTTLTFQLDTEAPVITVKDGASVINGVFTNIPSFKLMDRGSGQIDYVIANGVKHDRTNSKWSDLNAGNYKALQGQNVITVFDTAGNSTTFDFELDTIAPEVVDITQKYESKEGGRTAVTLTFSEPIVAGTLGQGWYGSGDTYTKVFYRAKEVTVNFGDRVGHQGSYTFTADAPKAPSAETEQAEADAPAKKAPAAEKADEAATPAKPAPATKDEAPAKTEAKADKQEPADKTDASPKASDPVDSPATDDATDEDHSES